MSNRTALATTAEVATYLRRTVKTLTNWRYAGIGPAYVKVGRGIRYRWSEVERWLDSQTKAAA